MRKLGLFGAVLFAAGVLLFSVGASKASAAQIFCPAPDEGKLCGMTQAYNMTAKCALSGSDGYNGSNRILGGQKCSFGGADDGGYYMIGRGEPDSSTPMYPFGPGTAPGWTYGKSGNLFTGGSIPSGEWQSNDNTSKYYLYRFFGGSVSVFQPKADDESTLQIGSNYTYWTGCNHNNFKRVFTDSCPAKNPMYMDSSGHATVNASPGDTLIFDTQNDLRPNGSSVAIWGSGEVTVTLDKVTMCYTSAHKDYQNSITPGSYTDTRTFHPTADGKCEPEAAPRAELGLSKIAGLVSQPENDYSQNEDNFDVLNYGDAPLDWYVERHNQLEKWPSWLYQPSGSDFHVLDPQINGVPGTTPVNLPLYYKNSLINADYSTNPGGTPNYFEFDVVCGSPDCQLYGAAPAISSSIVGDRNLANLLDVLGKPFLNFANVAHGETLPLPAGQSRIGTYFWGGPLSGGYDLTANTGRLAYMNRAKTLIKNLGVKTIRLYIGPKADHDYFGSPMCNQNLTLADEARRSEFGTFLNDPQFSTIIITAYDIASSDCVAKNYLNPDFYTAQNTAKIEKEYSDLANYLRQFNKTFIISNWEGDSDTQRNPSAFEGYKKWLSARHAGIHSAAASNVFSAAEFGGTYIDTFADSSFFKNVVLSPNVNADYYSYSAYASINVSAGQLSSDIDSIRNFLSSSGKNSSNLVIGEYGFNSSVFGNDLAAQKLKDVTNVVLGKNIPYSIVWDSFGSGGYAGFGVYDNSENLTAEGRAIFPSPQPHISLSLSALSFSGTSGGAKPPGQTLIISNTGNAALNWTALQNPDRPATWCHVSQNSGSVVANFSENITVTVDDPTNVGSFSDCGFKISDQNADNSPQYIDVTYVVTAGNCPTGAATLSAASVEVGKTISVSAPSGFAKGSFQSSDSNTALVSGSTVTGKKSGVATISGAGWDYAPNGATNCALSGKSLTVTQTAVPLAAIVSVSYSVQFNVPGPDVTLTASSGSQGVTARKGETKEITVNSGDSVTLAWDSANANASSPVSASAGPGFSPANAPSGSAVVYAPAAAGTYSYSITIKGLSDIDGSSVNLAAASVKVTVNSGVLTPAVMPAVNLSITKRNDTTLNASTSQITITTGDKITLSWSSTNADTGTPVKSSNFGASGVSGSAEVTPPLGATTYTITVQNMTDTRNAGYKTAAASVSVAAFDIQTIPVGSFKINAAPQNNHVTTGRNVSYAVTADRNQFTDPINLSASRNCSPNPLPGLFFVNFSPNVISPNESSAMTISTYNGVSNLSPGTYCLNVVGIKTGANVSTSTGVSLEVGPVPPLSITNLSDSSKGKEFLVGQKWRMDLSPNVERNVPVELCGNQVKTNPDGGTFMVNLDCTPVSNLQASGLISSMSGPNTSPTDGSWRGEGVLQSGTEGKWTEWIRLGGTGGPVESKNEYFTVSAPKVSLAITNTTNFPSRPCASNTVCFYSTDNWQLKITSPISDGQVFICGTKNGTPLAQQCDAASALLGSNNGATGADGSWQANGTFNTADKGNWVEWAYVGGILSDDFKTVEGGTKSGNNVKFTVSDPSGYPQLVVNPPFANKNPGETASYTALYFADASSAGTDKTSQASWSSDAPGIASPIAKGQFMAAGAAGQSTTIRASYTPPGGTALNGSASFNIQAPLPPPSGLVISPRSQSGKPGDVKNFTAEYYPSVGNHYPVTNAVGSITWTSGDSSVASPVIGQNGSFRISSAAANGSQTTVKASYVTPDDSTAKGTATLSVSGSPPPPPGQCVSLAVDPYIASVVVGDTVYLQAYCNPPNFGPRFGITSAAAWGGDVNGFVQSLGGGVYKGLKPGTASISVSYGGATSNPVTINVFPPGTCNFEMANSNPTPIFIDFGRKDSIVISLDFGGYGSAPSNIKLELVNVSTTIINATLSDEYVTPFFKFVGFNVYSAPSDLTITLANPPSSAFLTAFQVKVTLFSGTTVCGDVRRPIIVSRNTSLGLRVDPTSVTLKLPNRPTADFTSCIASPASPGAYNYGACVYDATRLALWYIYDLTIATGEKIQLPDGAWKFRAKAGQYAGNTGVEVKMLVGSHMFNFINSEGNPDSRSVPDYIYGGASITNSSSTTGGRIEIIP